MATFRFIEDGLPRLDTDVNAMHPLQKAFEDRIVNRMYILRGSLAISADGSRYLNEHVQWMWEQYNRN